MTNLNHTKTNSPTEAMAAQTRSYCGVSGILCGGIDGLQIQPESLIGGRLNWESNSGFDAVFMSEPRGNISASRIT